MWILEDFVNTWNYTFVIVMTIAILIGTAITLRKMYKAEKNEKRISRSEKRRESGNQE